MDAQRLVRLGGLAAVLGGAALALYNSVEYVFFSGAPVSTLANLPGWLAFQIAGLFGVLFVLLGLFGLYGAQARRAGTLGVIGFVLALAGAVLFGGLSWAAAFLLPAVGRAAPGVVDGPDPLVGAGVIGTILLGNLGWIVFAAATLRAGVFPRWTGVLMLVAAIVPFVLQAAGSALPVGPVALGVAMMGMGYAVLSERAVPLLQQAPA